MAPALVAQRSPRAHATVRCGAGSAVQHSEAQYRTRMALHSEVQGSAVQHHAAQCSARALQHDACAAQHDGMSQRVVARGAQCNGECRSAKQHDAHNVVISYLDVLVHSCARTSTALRTDAEGAAARLREH